MVAATSTARDIVDFLSNAISISKVNRRFHSDFGLTCQRRDTRSCRYHNEHIAAKGLGFHGNPCCTAHAWFSTIRAN
jgi:hypothetical protein